MSTYANLNKQPDILEIKTREDEIKNLEYQTEKHHHEKTLRPLKIDNECYKKKYKS